MVHPKDRAKKIQIDRKKNAKSTKVHTPKNRRADKYKDVIYDDWFEQDIAILADMEDENEDLQR